MMHIFFQAEDGIRDADVTGVQTCALPISVLPKPVQQPMPLWIGGNSDAATRRAGRLGDGWIPSFITPAEFRVGVEKTCAHAAEARREVPGDHFGVLVNFWLDDDAARARATAAPV